MSSACARATRVLSRGSRLPASRRQIAVGLTPESRPSSTCVIWLRSRAFLRFSPKRSGSVALTSAAGLLDVAEKV